MANVVHFGEQYAKELLKYFALKSVTEGAYSHDLDVQFVGADDVYVYEVNVTELSNYDKTANVANTSRFGNVEEVSDHKYKFHLEKDVSLDRVIDRGNNNAQFNVKKMAKVMKAYTDKLIRPAKDSHRLLKWCQGAGIHQATAAAPDKDTIVATILTLHNAMIDEGAPATGATLFIPVEYKVPLMLAPQWEGLESGAGKMLRSGVIGKFDGMEVVPVSSRVMPEDVYFAIFYKDAIIAPEKINMFRGITDSENFDGDRFQYREKFDAFVIPSMWAGAACACKSSAVVATPTISMSGATATLACSTSGATVYYTLDGSDPRYDSADRKVSSGTVTMAHGDTIRVAAVADGKYTSAVAEKLYK